jgi:hypothetical protein
MVSMGAPPSEIDIKSLLKNFYQIVATMLILQKVEQTLCLNLVYRSTVWLILIATNQLRS